MNAQRVSKCHTAYQKVGQNPKAFQCGGSAVLNIASIGGIRKAFRTTATDSPNFGYDRRSGTRIYSKEAPAPAGRLCRPVRVPIGHKGAFDCAKL